MKLHQFGSCDKIVAYKTLITATTAIFIYCIPPRFLLSPLLLPKEFLADRFIFEDRRHLNVIFFYSELWTHKSATLTLIGISRKVCGFNSDISVIPRRILLRISEYKVPSFGRERSPTPHTHLHNHMWGYLVLSHRRQPAFRFIEIFAMQERNSGLYFQTNRDEGWLLKLLTHTDTHVAYCPITKFRWFTRYFMITSSEKSKNNCDLTKYFVQYFSYTNLLLSPLSCTINFNVT